MAGKNLNNRKRRGCQEIVFEIEEDDISPANSPQQEDMVNLEPSPKVPKTEGDFDSNLKRSKVDIPDLNNESNLKDPKTDENLEKESNNSDFKCGIVDTPKKEIKQTTDEEVSDKHISLERSLKKENEKEKEPSSLELEGNTDEKMKSVTCSLDSAIDTQFESSQEIVELPQKSLDDTVNIDTILENQKDWIVHDETFSASDVDMKEEHDKTDAADSKHLEDQVAALNAKNDLLEKELMMLKQKVSTCSCKQSEEEVKPLITVQILDDNIKQVFKKNLIKYFKSFPDFYVKYSNETSSIVIYKWLNKQETVTENGLGVTDINETVHENTPCENSPSKNKKKKKKKKGNDEVDSMFIVDTAPSSVYQNKIVRYSSKFTINENEGENIEDKSPKAPQNTCFNCEGNHSLKDCTEPKDFRKINAARLKMREKHAKSIRYHLEEDQKYAHLSAGKITKNLRKALGIEDNELPPYIYRMRMLGYPPGWMMDAQDASSSLSLFDSEGKDLNREVNSQKMVLDYNKVIDFPGFNLPVPRGTRDNHKRFSCPPFSRNHSKENMVNYLKQMHEQQKDNLEICDMEITIDENPKTVEVDPKDVPLPPDSEETSQESETSLADLERQKNELLAQLDESSETSFRNVNDESINTSKIIVLDETVDSSVILIDDSINQSTEENKVEDKLVKTSSFGTPILKSSSQFLRLPHADNFAQNVSPVINFENLPNSTGKYEQMTNVLAKVRKTLKSLNEDKS